MRKHLGGIAEHPAESKCHWQAVHGLFQYLCVSSLNLDYFLRVARERSVVSGGGGVAPKFRSRATRRRPKTIFRSSAITAEKRDGLR